MGIKSGCIAKPSILYGTSIVAVVLSLFVSTCEGESVGISSPNSGSQCENKIIFENDRLSLGLTYIGGGVRLGFHRGWAVEGRFVTGEESSLDGTVKAHYLSARLTKYLMSGRRWAPYGSFEAGTVKATDSSRKATGTAIGVVGGIEFAMTNKVSLTLEMGPYSISLKDKVGGAGGSVTDIVLGSALYWHIF